LCQATWIDIFTRSAHLDQTDSAFAMTRKTAIGLFVAILLPAVALLYPGTLDLQARLALALAAFTVAMWTFEPVPIEYSSLLLLLLLPLLGVLSFETAFSAFSGKAVWLIFSGMALSLSITETPLGARIARTIRSRVSSHGRLLFSIHVAGVVTALLIPSAVVRVLIFTPLLISLLKSLGERPGSRLSAAVVLSFVCATYYGGTGILTAGVPNLVILGVVESRGETIYWGQWAAYLLPVIGLLRVALIYGLIRIVIPLPKGPVLLHGPPPVDDVPETISSPEMKAIAVLSVGVLLWATDALHGIHPAFIGLGLVLVCYLPGWGPLSPVHLRKVNFPILIYIAAAFAVGHALEATGFSARASGLLSGLVSAAATGPITGLAALTLTILPFNFLGDTAAVAAIFTPVVLDLGAGLGLGTLPVALSAAVAASTICVPYQAAPFVLAYSFRYVGMGQFIRLMTLIAAGTLALLLPLNLLYWRILGLI
jgi:anion transporter